MAKCPKSLGDAAATVVVWNNIGKGYKSFDQPGSCYLISCRKGSGNWKMSWRMETNQYQQLWQCERKGEEKKKEKNSIWVGWEQNLSLIHSNISEDLKGKLAMNQHADIQVDSEIKISKRQTHTVLTAEFMVDPELLSQLHITKGNSCCKQKTTSAICQDV